MGFCRLGAHSTGQVPVTDLKAAEATGQARTRTEVAGSEVVAQTTWAEEMKMNKLPCEYTTLLDGPFLPF
jgi:hypothetical protein